MGQREDVTRRLAICLTTALLAVACTSGPDEPPTSSASADNGAGPSRVLPVKQVLPGIEAFVEHSRGLRFKRHVRVTLLGRKAFLAKLHEDQHDPKPIEVEKETAVLSSLGLVSPKVDLVKAFKTAYDEGTLGFYSSKKKRLYVRGRRATPGVRAVLAHELTHALTDQWFGIHRPRLDKSNQELGLGFTALIEGDAERTRKAYERSLSAADQARARREEGGDQKPPAVPQVVLVFIGFPYAVGPSFVDAVVTAGGLHALNRAYQHPPTSSEQLLDPQSYFSRDEPVHVDVPRADGHVLEHGDLGLIGLLLMLEHGLDRSTASRAVIGWGGDQFVVWRAGAGRWCLRDTVVMDYGQAQITLEQALSQWAATTDGRAHVEHQGKRTTFRTCSS